MPWKLNKQHLNAESVSFWSLKPSASNSHAKKVPCFLRYPLSKGNDIVCVVVPLLFIFYYFFYFFYFFYFTLSRGSRKRISLKPSTTSSESLTLPCFDRIPYNTPLSRLYMCRIQITVEPLSYDHAINTTNFPWPKGGHINRVPLYVK